VTWTPTVFGLAAFVCAAVAPASAAELFVASGAQGSGSSERPFSRIQDALNAARPGDTVTIFPGQYAESIRTARDGSPQRRIRIRAAGARGSVLLTYPGSVIRVDHAYHTIEGIVVDGEYGNDDAIDVNDGAHYLRIVDTEVRRSSRDLIDIASPHGVVIERCLVHHALNPANGRTDAHGIAAGAVRDLTIRDTEIHTFSGDGIQVDPGRLAPGWQNVRIERTRIWLSPLPRAENGFPSGTVTGENAVDTKASPALPRATLTLDDVTAYGFRGGLIGNMAAFNLKEHVTAVVDRVSVYDSEIGFRVRGGGPEDIGAWATIQNAVMHDVATAFRYEDDVRNLRIRHITLGRNVTRAFQAAASEARGLEVRNLLVLGALPAEGTHPSNRSARPNDFVDVGAHDYRLASISTAIDTGITLPAVTTDRARTARPRGRSSDAGAYEWVPR
jgi:hypothetical protein